MVEEKMRFKKTHASNHLSEYNNGLRKHEIKVSCTLVSTPWVFAFIKCLPLSREFTSTMLYSRITFVKDHSLSRVTAVCAQNLIFLLGNFLENGNNHGVLRQLASSPRSSTEGAPCSPASSREGPRLQPAPDPLSIPFSEWIPLCKLLVEMGTAHSGLPEYPRLGVVPELYSFSQGSS